MNITFNVALMEQHNNISFGLTPRKKTPVVVKPKNSQDTVPTKDIVALLDAMLARINSLRTNRGESAFHHGLN